MAAGSLLFFPSAFAWLLPLLFLAICPLAMIFMMRGMGSMSGRGNAPTAGATDDPAQRPTPAADAEATRLRAELDQLAAEKATFQGGAEKGSSTQGPSAIVPPRKSAAE